MIKDIIQKDIVAAMKAGNKMELSVLRFVMSEIKYAEIDKRKDLTDEEVVAVLQKEVKKRKDAIAMFRKNNRADIAADEEKQISVIEKYLPSQIPVQQIEKLVDETIKQAGAHSQMGQIIGMVMGQVKGRADGGMVSAIVKKKLGM